MCRLSIDFFENRSSNSSVILQTNKQTNELTNADERNILLDGSKHLWVTIPVRHSQGPPLPGSATPTVRLTLTTTLTLTLTPNPNPIPNPNPNPNPIPNPNPNPNPMPDRGSGGPWEWRTLGVASRYLGDRGIDPQGLGVLTP